MVRLSLCMIVKDEERNLAKCLASVQGLVDEIILVDTGSTDATTEIATKYGAKLYDFAWCDDFAAARNESLHYATGEWILVLDADETLAQCDHKSILKALSSYPKDAFVLILRNYTNDSTAAGWVSSRHDQYHESKVASGWWVVPKIRLFRSTPRIRYQGRVHESVRGSVQPERIGTLDVVIHHYGKLDHSRLKEKNILYEKMGEHKLVEENDAYTHLELGRQYIHNEKLAEAIRALERSIQLNSDIAESWFMLGSVNLMTGKLDLAQEQLIRARTLDATYAPIYLNLGVVYARKKEYQKAIPYFLRSIKLNPQNATAFKNLGVCFDEVGDRQGAYEAFKRALELNPTYSRTIQLG